MTRRVPGPIGTGPRAPRRPGRWPRNWALLYDSGHPGGQGVAGRLGRGDADHFAGRGAAQIRAASASTRVFPDPAGALSTDTSRPSVSTASAAAAWSSRSPRRARARARLRVVRAAGQRVLEPRRVRAERVRGLRARHARRAVRARLREPCALPWPAARASRTGCRRAAGRRCARRRAASCAAPRPASGASRQATGSNSEASARSARSSSSAAAAAGSMPVRGRTRPRYLITSARVHALFSCWASATAFCAARASSSSVGTAAVRAARARARAAAPAVPDRRRDRRQRDAEGARELVRPARVRLREIQRAVLRVARLEVRCLREVRELALGRRAAVPLLEPRRAAAQVRGDRRAARGEHAHHRAADALDLEAVAVVAGGPFQAEPGGEGFFQVLGDDRRDRADVLVVAERVRGPPFAVGAGPGDVGDLGVDVQLHVAVAGGVLQPVRHRQVRLVPLAGLPAVHPGAVGAGAGVAGFPLEVAEPGVDGLPDHLVDLADQGGPVRRRRQRRRPGGPGGRSRPREAWKIEIVLDSEIVRSKNRGSAGPG